MTILAGGIVDAVDMTPGLALGVTAYVLKGTLETVTSSITLQNDDALFFTMAAGATYEVEVVVAAKGAPGDILTDWNGPADISGGKWCLGPAVVGSTAVTDRDDSAGRFGFHGLGTDISYTLFSSASDSMIREWGVISSVTGGTFNFRWAQNSSSGTGTVVNANSYLKYTRVA